MSRRRIEGLVMTADAGVTGTPVATDMVLRQFPDEPLICVECPLCQSAQSRFLMHGCDRLFGLPGWYSLVQCERCAMKFVNPRPTAEALPRHYPDHYAPVM